MPIVKRNNVQTEIKETPRRISIPRTQGSGRTELEGSRGGGKKRESDINSQCPLTLQRLVVKQSKLRLFQKALFDHAG